MKELFCFILLTYVCFSCTNTSKENNKGTDKKKIRNKQENTVQMYPETVLSNKVEIYFPSDFAIMNMEEVVKTYPDPKRRPDIIFKSPEGNINFSFQHTQKRVFMSEMPEILEQLTARYKNNPTIEFINSQIEDINDKEYVVLEFISQGENNKVYNLLLVTSLEDRVMMCAFTCLMPYINEWKRKGNRIIRTIRIL